MKGAEVEGVSIEVWQGERRSLQPVECRVPHGGVQRDRHDLRLGVHDAAAAERSGEARQVHESIVLQCPGITDRHADISATEALGLAHPSSGRLKVRRRDHESTVFARTFDLHHLFEDHRDRAHGRFPSARSAASIHAATIGAKFMGLYASSS